MNDPSETKVVYDTQDMAKSEDKRYIVLGKSKYRDDGQRRCYVLLVSPETTGKQRYRPVGVAYMPESDFFSQSARQVTVY
jgi:hypothetical protein